MEYHISKQALETGTSYVNSQLGKVNCGRLRAYFDINNQYVIHKIILMLCPFLYKEADESGLYKPDLYIPSMALITLVLFNGFVLGLQNKFHPELLYMSFTRSIAIHCLLNLLYKFVSYVLGIGIDYLDILAYTGYRFSSVLLIKILKTTFIGKILSFYVYIAFFFFFSRSVKRMFLSQNVSKKNIYLLFSISVLEVVFAFYMCY